MKTQKGINMVAIINHRPMTVGILPILDAYIAHEKEAITRAIKNLYVFSPKTIRGKFSDVSRFVFESGLEEESSNVDYGIKKGDALYHRQYGDGKVKSIDGDKITLEFKGDIDRSFSLRVLMENNLIILIK